MTIEDITSDFDEGAGELIIKASEYCALCSRIKELEDALRIIKANSYYCNSCSASLYAEEALEQFDEVKQEGKG